jgi:cobalamin synthase
MAVSALFIGGFLMSIPDTMPDDRKGFVGVAIALCATLLLRSLLLVFYAYRSEIARKIGIAISSVNVLVNALSFVRSLLALESGEMGAPSGIFPKIMAMDWIPFETTTAVVSIIASLIFIILAFNADSAFPRKDPVLSFFRGDGS